MKVDSGVSVHFKENGNNNYKMYLPTFWKLTMEAQVSRAYKIAGYGLPVGIFGTPLSILSALIPSQTEKESRLA